MAYFRECLTWAVSLALLAGFGLAPAKAQQVGHPLQKDPRLQRYAFTFNNAPWSEALERLSQITDLPLLGSKPIGSFTFIPPNPGGREMQYTVPEIIDILNEKLAERMYMLVRRQASILLWPLDEPIEPGFCSAIAIEDLASRGKTELGKVLYHRQGVPTQDLAPILRKIMGRNGPTIVDIEDRLALFGSVGNLLDTLEAMRERADLVRCPLWVHRCQDCKAAAVATRLEAFIRSSEQQRRATRTKVIVAVDDATNTIFVSGPAAGLSRARMFTLDLEAMSR